MVYWRILGAWKKKNKFAVVIWMHTEVTLLYELYYSRNCRLPQKHCFIGDPHRSLDDHNQSDYGGK